MNAITLYYRGRWFYLHHMKIAAKICLGLMYFFYNCYIPYTSDIGSNCKIAYKGMSVVIHARAKIGNNVTIGTCVTIGGNKKEFKVPVIGDNCYLATGCKVFGDTRIGDGSFIGANTVVTKDIPPKSLVSGIPARVIKENIDINEYY